MMNWVDNFIQQAKEFDKQLNELKNVCDQYGIDYEQKKEHAKYLAQTSTMSNEEALYYVIDKTNKDEWYKTAIKNYNKIKGEYDMFDVNKIKLGDYVETRDGRIGYVVENKWSLGENRFAVQFNNGDIYSILVCTITNKHFKQIGSYKFDENKGEKKPKIKPLTYTEINCVDIYSGKTLCKVD